MTCTALTADVGHFNETLLDCIEDAVKSILGKQVLESLLVNLETFDGLTREEIPRRLNVFFPALERAFGETSGRTVGRFIIKVLYVRLGLEFNGRSNQVLLDYVEDARRKVGENW